MRWIPFLVAAAILSPGLFEPARLAYLMPVAIFAALFIIIGMHVTGMNPEARKDRARTDAMRAFADANDYHFTTAPEYTESLDLIASLNDFPMFQGMRKHKVIGGELTEKQKAQLTRTMSWLRAHPMTNVMSGKKNGHQFVLFDYRDTRSTTQKRTRFRRRTPIIVEMPGALLPNFAMAPEKESFLTGLLKLAGLPDIDLSGFPRFSEAFRLTGREATAVTALFESGPARFFEEHAVVFRDCFVQGSGSRLLICRGEERLAVDALEELIEEAVRAAAMFERAC